MGYIHVINIDGVGYAYNNTRTSQGFDASCEVKIDFVNGIFYIGCGSNTWGLSSFPMNIAANTIKYR